MAAPSNIIVPKLNAAPAGPKPTTAKRRADRHELEQLESSFWETLFGRRATDGAPPAQPGQARSRSRATGRTGQRSLSRGEMRPVSRMTAARLPEDWERIAQDAAAPAIAPGDILMPPPMPLDELRALAAAAARSAAAPSPSPAAALRAGFMQSARPIVGGQAYSVPRIVPPPPEVAAAHATAVARRTAPTAQPLPTVVRKTEEEEDRESLGVISAPVPSFEMAPLFGSDTRNGAASGYGATEAASDLGDRDAWWNSSVYVNPGAEPSPAEDLQRVAANVVLVVTQLISPNLSMAKLSTMHLGSGAKTLLTPAPYAATVWNVIYAGCVCYALFQSPLLAREAPLLRRVGWYTAGAFAATSAWAALVSLADRGPYLPTSLAVLTAGAEPLAWAIAICSAVTWALLGLVLRGLAQHVHPFTLGEHLFVVMPLSLYAGWVTILTAVNYGGAMLASGVMVVSILSPHRAVAGLLVLAAGGVCSSEVVAARGNPWYALGAVWGLLGISASNWRFHKGLNILSISGIVGSVVVLVAAAIRVALLRRRKWRVPWGAARLLLVRLRTCAGRSGRGPNMLSALWTRITTGAWPRGGSIGARGGDIEAGDSPVQLQMMAKPGSATKTPPAKSSAAAAAKVANSGTIPLVRPGAAPLAKPGAPAAKPAAPAAAKPVAVKPPPAAPANTPVSSPAPKAAPAAAAASPAAPISAAAAAAASKSPNVASPRTIQPPPAPPPKMPASPREAASAAVLAPRTTTMRFAP